MINFILKFFPAHTHFEVKGHLEQIFKKKIIWFQDYYIITYFETYYSITDEWSKWYRIKKQIKTLLFHFKKILKIYLLWNNRKIPIDVRKSLTTYFLCLTLEDFKNIRKYHDN